MRARRGSYLNDDHKLRERAWYYSMIYADPKDAERPLGAARSAFYKSTDGGVTWRHVPDPHGDNHDMWIAPNDGQRFIQSSDGGASVTYNGGRTWTLQDYATAQFYHVSTTMHFPYRVCGAQQDNSAMCGPSRYPGGIPLDQWYDPGGGESGWIEAIPSQPDLTYGGDNSGLLTLKDHRTDFTRVINVWPDSARRPRGGRAEVPLPVDGAAPHLAARSTNVVFTAGNVVFKTHEPRAELDADLARSHAQRSEDHRHLRRSDHARPDDGRVLRDGVRDRAVAAQQGRDVGGLG